MGVVFEALDRERGKRVALKTIKDPQPGALLRFKNEFRALHDLRHPNLISIGELHEERGQWFFTMELVDGVDLLSWVRGEDRPFDATRPATQSLGLVQTEALDVSGIRARGSLSSAPTLASDDRTSVSSSGRVHVASVPSGTKILVDPEAPVSLPGYNERRVRAALLQLAHALDALHRAHRVHRDVKPSNVLVTGDGRVVLLDFGLVEEIRASGSGEVELCGTAEYMAPEQAAAENVGPASDWYAVGVMLYEVLVGVFPFNGPPIAILTAKQVQTPTPPSTISPAVPHDLEALCLELLSIDPASRPTAADVIARLTETTSTAAAADASFVGRTRELEALSAAASDARLHPVTIVIEGESGLGKTALARRFVDSLREGDTLVLEGRCYERETVTFKAFDGVVDALARHLRTLPDPELEELIPPDAAILREAFPVLGVVRAIAHAPLAKNAIDDPAERRNRLYGAMRVLFARLANKRPLVLSIDDLQWADGDSIALLHEILREPDAPNIAVVATARPGAEALEGLTADRRSLRLGRLDPDDARALATALGGADRLEHVLKEAGGHPLFIDALVRSGGRVDASLDDAIVARVRELDDETRRLVEVVSLTGAPIQQDVARRAAELSADVLADRAQTAWSRRLLKTGGPRLSDPIEPYHDRVRESVVASLDPERKKQLHAAIVSALSSVEDAEPELLAVHALGAGDTTLGVRELVRAADRAFTSLAFDRAAALYRRALELGLDDATERQRVQIRLGDTLAIAGRGAEAAAAYGEARGGDSALTFELDRRIAEQLLFSGHLTRGKAALADVLAGLGLGFAKTPLRALLMALLRRLWLRIRGYRFVLRDRKEIDPQQILVLDVLWTAVRGIMFIDFLRGIDFQTRYIKRVLAAGDRRHLANGLAAEGSSSAATGGAGLARSAKLFAALDEISTPIEDPAVHAHNESHKSFMQFMAGDFRAARVHGERGASMYAEHCLGVNWYLVAMRRYLVYSYYYLGDFLELQRKLKLWRTDAHRRDDLFAMANYSLGLANTSWLIDDDVEGACEDIARTLGKWAIDGFTMQHYQAIFARTQVALYEGDGRTAWAGIDAAWRDVKRALFLKVRSVGIEGVHLRGRAAVAHAAALPEAQRRAPLSEARRAAAALRKDGLAWARGFAAALEGAIAELSADRPAALGALREARASFREASMELYASAAQHTLATLGGRPDEVAEIERAMRAQAIAKPDKLVRMMIPGFPRGEREPVRSSTPK